MNTKISKALEYANTAASTMKAILKMNDPQKMKKAAMQSAAGIAGIENILKNEDDNKDNIRRLEQRDMR